MLLKISNGLLNTPAEVFERDAIEGKLWEEKSPSGGEEVGSGSGQNNNGEMGEMEITVIMEAAREVMEAHRQMRRNAIAAAQN